MDKDGCIVIENFFTIDELDEIKREFSRLIDTVKINDEFKTQYFSSQRFPESYLFNKLAFNQNFIDFAEYYYGKSALLIASNGARHLPFSGCDDYGSFQWHHDGKRKQFKVMILLSDTPKDGQCTYYIKGSYKVFRYNTSNTRIKENELDRDASIIKCAGATGTVIFFDSNGVHRGNRNGGPTRDTWQYTYRAVGSFSQQHKKQLLLSPLVVTELNAYQRKIARLAFN